MRKLNILFSVLMMLVVFPVKGAQSSSVDVAIPYEMVYTLEDQQIFQRYVGYIGQWQSAPIDTLLEKTALFFLESPYVSHTLEVEGEERLVVNLREFDCTTFVESVIALARMVRSGSFELDTFFRELQSVRYRDGNLQGYASRLHYISDWVYNNEKKELLKNISGALGGVSEKKAINFMTTHRNAYRQLKDNDRLLQEIQVIESNINTRGGFHYLPKENISTMASMIPHMSMVAFTTSIKGLDVSHMGFAFQTGAGRLTFIHASSTLKKVVIDQKTLIGYCAGQSSCTGIIVAEVL